MDNETLGLQIKLNEQVSGPASQAAQGISALTQALAAAQTKYEALRAALHEVGEIEGVSKTYRDMARELHRVSEEVTTLERQIYALQNAGAGSSQAQPQQQAAQAIEQTTQAAARLTTQMQLVAQVAKEYGISGAEASRLVAQEAAAAGTSIARMAQIILNEAEMERQGVEAIGTAFRGLPLTEQNSILMQRLQIIEALAQRQAALSGEGFGPAAQTGFGQAMQGMSDEDWNKYTQSLGQTTQAQQQQTQASQQQTQAQQAVATATTAAGQAGLQTMQVWNLLSKSAQDAAESTSDYEKRIIAWQRAGRSTAEAASEIAMAERARIPVEQQLQEAAETRDVQVRLDIENGKTLAESQKGLAAAGKAEADAIRETNNLRDMGSRSAREAGQMFFGLTIASFGLMEVQKQLAESSSDLAGPLDKIIGLLRTTSSLGSAGAFLGGAPGAMIGATIGLLIDLPELLDNTTAGEKELLKSLDSLATKTDAVKTLSDLTGMTYEQAKAAEKAAQTNPEYANSLLEVAKASHQVSNAQRGLIDIGSEVMDFLSELPKKALEAYVGAAEAMAMGAYHTQHFGLDSSKESWDQTAEAIRRNRDQIFGLSRDIEKLGAAQDALKRQQLGQEVLDTYAKAASMFKDIATGDAESQISNLSGATRDVVERFIEFAKAHKDVAEAADELTAKIIQDEKAIAMMTNTDMVSLRIKAEKTEKLRQEKDALNELIQTHQDYTAVLEKAIAAEKRFADALAQASEKEQQAKDKAIEQGKQAQQQYDNSAADAARARGQAIANAERQHSDRVADINQQLADKLSDIWTNYGQKISDIWVNYEQKVADIQMNLANKIADIESQLRDKLQSLAKSYQDKLTSINYQIVDQQQQTADKLYQIERSRIEDLEKLGFNTHEQLMEAQTQHDRDRIMRKAQFEAGQINQRANDAMTDAERELAQAERKAQRERQLALQNYQYERQLAIQKEQEDIARAQREAQQQMAIALREANQAQALALREAQQAEALAKRTADEQIKQADRALHEQVAAAIQAEQSKLADAQRNLTQRLAAIEAQKQAELAAIEQTRIKAQEAYMQQLQQIGSLITLWNAYLSQFGAAGRITANLFQDWMKGFDKLLPQPSANQFSGLPNIPGIQGLPGSGKNEINIHVHGATNAKEVATEVKNVLANEVFRYGAAYG